MTGIYVILGVVALLVVIGIVQYNKLVRLNVAVDEGFAQIEVQLQRRGDLIPNLVETVKGYASHEKETFEKVVQARAQATAAQGVAAVAEADGMLAIIRKPLGLSDVLLHPLTDLSTKSVVWISWLINLFQGKSKPLY